MVAKPRETFKEFICKIALTHIGFMKDTDYFPQECVLSSHLLGSYLNERFPELNIVYGTFGKNQLFHSWIEYENMIVDFTVFQFLTYKEKSSFYSKLAPEEMIKYIFVHQGSIFIEEDSVYYQEYTPFFYPSPKFPAYVEKYKSYLNQMAEKLHVLGNWEENKDKHGRMFKEVLESQNNRIGKKFFTKWAILNK